MPHEQEDSLDYSARCGFIRRDLWLIPGVLALGLAGGAMMFTRLGEGYRDLPRPVEQALGALIAIGATVFIALKVASAITRPLGLRADDNGITLRVYSPFGRLTVIPWYEVSTLNVHTKQISRTKITYLVVKRRARMRPLRRRNPLTNPRLPNTDPEHDAAVSINQWWHLDHERFTAAVRAFAPHVRIELD